MTSMGWVTSLPPISPPPGAGSGLGAAVSLRLGRGGARVALCDLDVDAAARTLARLRAEDARGGAHAAFQADVADADAVEGLLQQVQAVLGSAPRVLVSCAGVTRDDFLLRLSERDWDAVLDVNLKGTFLVMQAAARALVADGDGGGSFITVGSIVGKVGNLGQANYAASKAGVEGLTRAAARELARHGIRCNAVLPGFIATPMTQKVPQKVLDKVAALIPMGHLGAPEDVADVVAFLASEDSSYITGASLEVTGGLFM
ncbi:estradiol 17-beta-dehydrogenase 8 isoform X1 [Tachyglossus aculeatus]|uniref:estradiol 17-beta-dehydrogenase 8 isoform X1 n=1 Tax=Tachyglossus aculeatus TaxID=9261 RepID=UPI0018F33FEB|nr:estradiol 17-beta-dehydrogenase 8 isoform X1 [Tachyglossus aculeatus]